MEAIENLNWIEAIGWFASLITIATYSVNTMLPLRLLASLSSFSFGLYALILGLWPLLVMELILIPINLYRLWQVYSLRGKLNMASNGHRADFSIIKTYGKRLRIEAGEIVFERGDKVDQLYYLAEGRIQIEHLGIELEAGEIFGEIAFFTEAATRTATARCVETAEVYGITEAQLMRLQFEDPSFGLAIMRRITHRLMDNVNSAPCAKCGANP